MEPTRRIDYAGSVHDEREIEAVVAVLRGGPQALRIGRNVRALEQGVADPDEIVGPVVYLASDASSFVTGDDISVSGGMPE